jgi:hypothetical protein
MNSFTGIVCRCDGGPDFHLTACNEDQRKRQSSSHRTRRFPATQAGPGLPRSGDVLRGGYAEPALDCGGGQRGAGHGGDLVDRPGDHLHPAGIVRARTVFALSPGRRHVCLEQARLRRLRRLSDRVDLLDQQAALFPRGALLRGQQCSLCRRQQMERIARQCRILHDIFATGA